MSIPKEGRKRYKTMKKMRVTKTIYRNDIRYAFLNLSGETPSADFGTLRVYSGEPLTETKAKKILRSENSAYSFVRVESDCSTYAMDTEEFIENAECIKE